MGKPRVIAETGAGQHGVATATAAALLGPRVRGLHGRGGHPPPGARTWRACSCSAPRSSRSRSGSRHPQGRDQRGHARLGDQRRDHPLPAGHGRRTRTLPARWSVSSTGSSATEARQQCLERRRAARRRRRLRRRRVECDRDLLRVPRRRGSACTASRPPATASRPGGMRRRCRPARSGCCTAPAPTCCRTTNGQTHGQPLDLGRPGLPGGRSRTRLAARLRAGSSTRASPTPRRWPLSSCAAANRGDHPGHRERPRCRRRPAARRSAWAPTPRS